MTMRFSKTPEGKAIVKQLNADMGEICNDVGESPTIIFIIRKALDAGYEAHAQPRKRS